MKTYLKILAAFMLLLLTAMPSSLEAHAPDQTYLYVRVYQERIECTVEIKLEDLNRALNLTIDPKKYAPENDEDEGLKPLPEELKMYHAQVEAYVLERVGISSPKYGNHAFKFTEPELLLLEMGVYWETNFELENVQDIPDALDIRYEVMFDVDPIQRGLTVVGHNWKAGIVNNESMSALIFSPEDTQQQLSLTDASLWKGFKAMVGLGMWHIWIGLDHILFLVALVLPSVVRRRRREGELALSETWTPVESFKSAFWYILKIVTLFTIAHSITLSLAALGVIDLSSRIVESIIALSIALAAYLNLRPLFNRSESFIAFAFGLFHGLGFASVLGEKGLGGEYMTLSLLGFNVGVELGQVLIICMVFPFLFLLRRTKLYPYIIFYGSILLIIIAFYWFVERFFEINLLADDYISWFWRKATNKIMHILGLR